MVRQGSRDPRPVCCVWAVPLPQHHRGCGGGCEGAADCAALAPRWPWRSVWAGLSVKWHVWNQGLSRREEGQGTRWQHYFVKNAEVGLSWNTWTTLDISNIIPLLLSHSTETWYFAQRKSRLGLFLFFVPHPQFAFPAASCHISLHSLNNWLAANVVSLWQGVGWGGVEYTLLLQGLFQVLVLTSPECWATAAPSFVAVLSSVRTINTECESMAWGRQLDESA